MGEEEEEEEKGNVILNNPEVDKTYSVVLYPSN